MTLILGYGLGRVNGTRPRLSVPFGVIPSRLTFFQQTGDSCRNWYGRWWEDVLEDGRVVRRQKARKLAEFCDRYRTERDVRPLLEEILRPVNEGKAQPEGTLPVAKFVESYYLPFAYENCKPSTYAAYKTQWDSYLAPRLRDVILRDFRTVDAANILADVHRTHGLGRSTLRHLKAFLSVVFTFAKNQGVLDGVNPVRDAMIPKKAAAPEETYAVTPDEMLAMMDALEKAGEKQAQAALALMFFAGLRPGEARGARWENFDGKRLIVRQSIWRTYATEPKTFESSKPIPIIEPLRSVLAELCSADGNPPDGPILRGPKGKPSISIILLNVKFGRYSQRLVYDGTAGMRSDVESLRWSMLWKRMRWRLKACSGTLA